MELFLVTFLMFSLGILGVQFFFYLDSKTKNDNRPSHERHK
jgi:hypothetical protein